MKTRQIVKTNDDSSTLFVPELNQHYHSIHGAIQESQHVFIDAGFNFKKDFNPLKIFEAGFGTGLNAFMTMQNARSENLSCEYWAIEKYPLSDQEASHLNYPSLLDSESSTKHFLELHNSSWGELNKMHDFFHLKKIQGDLKEIELPTNYFDLIYYDAFAPSSQADLWTIEVFKKMCDCLKNNGTLVSYCVKGDVRRNMAAAGFKVDKIPGPPGKREMARATAIKPQSDASK